MSNQPRWKLVANLGDVNPLEHGGYFVFEDETGVYGAEGEVLILDGDGSEVPIYTVYRFPLERATFTDGILSDNPYHPSHPAWFAKPERERKERPQDTTYLLNVCRSAGIRYLEMVSLFTSEFATERAEGYRCVGEYHGWENLDSYPLHLTREEAEERYAALVR